MSKQIDEKVVSMKFDNKQFESGVSTTMSTLDKLKSKLNFSGASKGLEQINTAANKVDMKGMSNAVDTVQMKLSAMQVVGVTALANITNQAVEAGKKIVNALTLEPVLTGFEEYKTQLNATQSILANVEHKGKSIEDVNKALDELNVYADETIYNFTEMTRNIGLFVNAGVDLDKSVAAIKGFSNAAAIAGTDATRTSMAMYQLSQAMSSGVVQLMDWRSLEQANITGERFQNAIIETARVHGIAIDDMIEKEGNLRNTLSEKWLTADIMAEALNHFTLSREKMTEEEQKARTEMMLSQGYTMEQINSLFDLGTVATESATKVKDLSQMFGVLKETAQSGWSQTWRIIFGDVEQAKALFTPLTNFFSEIIQGFSEARNTLLEGAFGKNFKQLGETIKGISKPIEATSDAIKTITKTAQDYSKVVDDIILGKYKNAPERYQLLTQAGYDWAHAQNLVNERLGSSVRHATNYSEAQEQVVETTQQTTQSMDDYIEDLAKMSKEQLIAKGYTEEQADALKQLAEMADKTGIPLKEFIENIDQIDGRYLLLNALKNAGQGVYAVISSIGKAWRDVFPAMNSDQLFNIIAALHKFSTALVVSDETADKVRRTFKGLFAILDIGLTLIGGPLKLAIKILGQFLEVLGMIPHDFLGITAAIGDGIVGVRDWLDKIMDFTDVFEKFIPSIKAAGEAIANWVKGIKEADNIGLYIIQGLMNGLNSAVNGVIEFFKAIGTKIIEAICSVLGIHSPSTEFFTIGQNIIQGLVNGLQNGFSWVWNAISSLGKGIIEFIKAIDIGRVVALVIGAGLIAAAVKLSNSMLSLANGVVAPLVGLENLLSDLGDAAGNLAKGVKFKMIAEGIKSIAIAIGILAISLIALSRLSWGEIGKALVTLGALALGLTALTFALSKMSFKGLNSKGIGKLSLTLLSLSVVLVIVSQAMKNVGNMDVGQLTKAIIGLIAMVAALTLLMKAIGKFVNGKDLKNISKIGAMIRKVSFSLLLLVGVMKLASMLKAEEVLSGTVVMGLFYAFIISLMKITKVAKASDADKLGKMIRKVSTSLLIMIAVMKLASMLKAEEVIKGIAFMTAMGVFMSALMVVSKFGGENAAKLGVMMIGLSVSLLLMVGVCKLIGMMSVEEITKGIVAIGAFSLFMSLLMAVNKNGKGAVKLGAMLIMVAGAMAILAGVIFIIGQFKPSEIAKGLVVIGILSAFFAGLMYMSQFTSDASIGALKKMTIILVLLTAAVALLSFIDTKKALTATAGLSAVMFAFASMLAATGKVKVTKGVMRNVTIMTLIVTLLAGVIAALSLLPNSSSIIPIAGSLAGLMAAMSLVLVILSNTKANKKVLTNIGYLTAMALPLLAFVGVLAVANNIQNAITNVGALTLLATAMTLLLIPLTLIGQIGGIKNVAVGVLALTAMAVPLLAFVGVLCLANNIQNAITNVQALTTLATVLTLLLIPLTAIGAIMSTGVGAIAVVAGIVALAGMAVPLLAFVGVLAVMNNIQNATANAQLLIGLTTILTDALVKISLVAPLAAIADVALLGLVGIITLFGVLATAIGALMQQFPQLQSFLDTGLPVLAQISNGIGQVLGNLIGGFMSGVSQGLVDIGIALQQFGVYVMPFITTMKTVDESALNGIKNITAAILLLTAADLISGITSFLSGGESFSTLGKELTNFGINIMPFLAMLSTLPPNIGQVVKSLADAILAITAADLLNNITSFISGESSLASFGSELGQLGSGLSGFVTSLGTFTEEQVTTVDCAARAIKALADASKEIPGEGGIWQAIVGDNSIATFGSKLPALGSNLAAFVTNLGTFSDDQVKTVECAGNAIKALAQAANEIPNTGGLVSWFTGDNDISTFASKLPNVATYLKEFMTNLTGEGGTFGDQQVNTIMCGVNALKGIIEAANSIPNSGGLGSLFSGDNDIEKFGEKLPGVGSALKEFMNSVGEFGTDKLDTVNTAITALQNIAGLGGTDFKTVGENLPPFGDKLIEFSGKLKSFIDGMSQLDQEVLNGSVDKLKNFVTYISELGNMDFSSLSNLGESLKTLATDSINQFIEGLSGEATKEQVRTALTNMLSALTTKADEQKATIKTKFTEVAQEAINGLNDSNVKSQAEQVGLYFVQGFANGINNNKNLARNAGSAIGRAALSAAKQAIDAHSPSKESHKLGVFFDQGFVNGIISLRNKIYDSSYSVGSYAKDALNRSLMRIADIIDNNIDVNPSIRPVMDLSDIENGAAAIDSLLSTTHSVGLMNNLNAISYGMRNRQNGNDDVISAIDKLGKSLGNSRGDTYSINGITYDDGSNIKEAVETLVRAAKVERRK